MPAMLTDPPPAPRPQPGVAVPENTLPVAPVVPNGGGVLERSGVPSSVAQALDAAMARSTAARQQAATNIEGLRTQQTQARQAMAEIPHTPPPKFEDIPEAPDTQKPTDALRVFGQVLPVLAMLGGAFVRNNASAALQAGASAMNAARQNDATALEQAHQQWTDHLQAIRARNESVLQRWNAIANDEHMSRQDKLAEFNAIAAEMNSEVALENVRSGDLAPLIQYGQMYQNAHNQLVQQMAEQERINIQREAASTLTPNSIDYYAQQFRMTGRLPALGVGAAGTAMRGHILERAAEMASGEGATGEADSIRASNFRANQAALSQLQRQRTMVGAFERAALANLAIAEEYSARVGRTGVPVFNRWIQAGQRSVAGDPEVAAFNVAVNTFVNEYAKIMSGSTGAAGATEGARHDAMQLLSTADSPAAFREIVSVMRRDMQNRAMGYEQQEQALRQSMASMGLNDTDTPSAVQSQQPGAGYDPNDPSTWTSEQRQQWLAENPE